MGEEEDDFVGNRAAGQATWDRLIEGTVGKLPHVCVSTHLDASTIGSRVDRDQAKAIPLPTSSTTPFSTSRQPL